ncbi:c-type cytochrome [Donghicola mangrovi]|uniref:Cytochrome c n=1 Tax=Donghicola mangrovi TaxID=2729614 RepID=A0A850Q5H0_9RHOB|nr:cytochrome c [Donghicola mangrovi]NVO24366.1 cytochrome c [Donghicola mangrovi]
MKKTFVTLTLIAMGTAALSHGGVQDKNVMARMEVMKTIGSQMKLIGKMAKGETAFDAAAVNAALTEIAAQAALVPDSFETPATDPKSEALPLIWEQFDDFTKLAGDLESTAANLAGTVQTDADLGPVMGQMGATCKACHSTYRE